MLLEADGNAPGCDGITDALMLLLGLVEMQSGWELQMPIIPAETFPGMLPPRSQDGQILPMNNDERRKQRAAPPGGTWLQLQR